MKNVSLIRLLRAIPALILMTFLNVIISFCVASAVFFQVLISGFASREWALATAIVAAIVVHFYIRYNHRIQNLISSKDNTEA